jgi:asparagine synthase (glutamine-hydrolysing)
VEGRYPFLDHDLFAWTAKLPVTAKLRGLRDKRILRQWATGRLPRTITVRPKQPYRAPDAGAFFGGARAPEYVRELLDAPAIKDAGYFDPAAVHGLAQRCRAGRVKSTRENQALVAILSTQLWHYTFFTKGLRNEARPMSNKQTEQMVSP